MKAILIALIALFGLTVFFFGGSIPKTYNQFRTQSFKLEFRPIINIGGMFGDFGKGKGPGY